MMKTKRTPSSSLVSLALASALAVALPAWAQNLTVNQTQSLTESDFYGDTWTITVTLDGPVFVTSASGGQPVSVRASVTTSGVNTPVAIFGSGGSLNLNGQPFTTAITVGNTNDGFLVAGNYTDTTDDGFKDYGSVKIDMPDTPLKYEPPPYGAPISLEAGTITNGLASGIDVENTASFIPSYLVPDGLFKNGGNFALSGLVVEEGTGGTADVGTISMNVPINYGYWTLFYYEPVGTAQLPAITVQYVRGDHLLQPVVTAVAGPSPLPNTGTNVETITVQIFNPSPDLATTNGTLRIDPASISGFMPPPDVQNIAIPPRGTVTETFTLTPSSLNTSIIKYDPHIEFTTGWQSPVPAANFSQPIYASAPFTVTPPNVQVTVDTSPNGPSFTVDGVTYTYGQTFSWPEGSSHTISTHASQAGITPLVAGQQYLWEYWGNGVGANLGLPVSCTVVAPTTQTPATYTAEFFVQNFLTMNAETGGTVSPPSGWIGEYINNGVYIDVQINATTNSGYRFSGWIGGEGSSEYTGPMNPYTFMMGTPVSETAYFTNLAN